MATTSTNQVIGIVLLVLGLLLLLGWLNVPYLATIIGVVLIVLGVMALIGAGRMPKNAVLGVVLVVLGILVLIPRLGLGGAIASVIETIVAIVLIIAGLLKLVGKW